MSRPTKLTITSMMAASGSSTQPSCSVDSPIWNQGKLWITRTARYGSGGFGKTENAMHETAEEIARAARASAAAGRRLRCFITAISPAANSGNTGMSQGYWTIQFTSIFGGQLGGIFGEPSAKGKVSWPPHRTGQPHECLNGATSPGFLQLVANDPRLRDAGLGCHLLQPDSEVLI